MRQLKPAPLLARIASLAILLSPGCLSPGDGGGMEICTERPTGSLICYSTSPANRIPVVSPVLGQGSGSTSAAQDGATGMTAPGYIASDGTHLAVSDSGNNRVLLWNSIPSAVDQPADLVIGQQTMTDTNVNEGGSAGASTLNNPLGIAISAGKLLVADTSNNRVLIWNSWPTTNGQAADVVVGQPDFTTTTSNLTTQTSVWAPGHVSVDPSGHVFVTDTHNNRVLYFSAIPTTNGAPADFVLGQTSFTAGGTATSQRGFNSPQAASGGLGYVAVADSNNNRVLIFADPPTGNGPLATTVLGQSSYTSAAPGCSQTGLTDPLGVYVRPAGGLYVADTTNNRVLRWSSVAGLTNGQAAAGVFGQPDFVTCSLAATPSLTNYNTPNDAYSDSWGYLWVVDSFNNRVTANLWQ